MLISELNPEILKSAHVVYVGYLSGLGMLQDLVFAGSGLDVGGSYDELVDRNSGTHYFSGVGVPRVARRSAKQAAQSSGDGLNPNSVWNARRCTTHRPPWPCGRKLSESRSDRQVLCIETRCHATPGSIRSASSMSVRRRDFAKRNAGGKA